MRPLWGELNTRGAESSPGLATLNGGESSPSIASTSLRLMPKTLVLIGPATAASRESPVNSANVCSDALIRAVSAKIATLYPLLNLAFSRHYSQHVAPKR